MNPVNFPRLYPLTTVTLIACGLVAGHLHPAQAIALKSQTYAAPVNSLGQPPDLRIQIQTSQASAQARPASTSINRSPQPSSGPLAQTAAPAAAGLNLVGITYIVWVVWRLIDLITGQPRAVSQPPAPPSPTPPQAPSMAPILQQIILAPPPATPMPPQASVQPLPEPGIQSPAPQAVPTPALLPGLVGRGVAALRKRRQSETPAA